MRHATVRSQIWERTDRNAIILLIILFTFLSPPNTYLSPSATQLFLSLLSGLHLSVASYFFLIFIFLSLTLFLSLYISVLSPQIQPVSAPLSLFFFFSCHYLSLFLFLSWRRRQSRSKVELADWSSPIWTSTRRSEALLAQGQSPIFAHHPPQLLPLIVVEFGRWLICWVGVLLKILSFFFFFFFGWGFWIWNLLEDLVIVVVVCGDGCSCGCWFLGGGDCHWLCICIFAGFWVNILF